MQLGLSLSEMQQQRNLVVTVDREDNDTGTMEKIEAHQAGVLHRAFSVFLLNSENELLLQRRALGKYHSGGLWTNTCCSHPMPGEETIQAAHRRLEEEMGIQCDLQPLFIFTYKADVGEGLTEHELDHVLVGRFEGECSPNAEEVMEYKYIALEELGSLLDQKPEEFTAWLKIAFSQFQKELKARNII